MFIPLNILMIQNENKKSMLEIHTEVTQRGRTQFRGLIIKKFNKGIVDAEVRRLRRSVLSLLVLVRMILYNVISILIIFF